MQSSLNSCLKPYLTYLKVYSRFIPHFFKKRGWLITTVFFLILISSSPLSARHLEGISIYYIRFDLKSSSHRITDGKLTMVPSEEDFRAAKFSYFPVSGIIPALPQEAGRTIEAKAKQNAFIQLLQQKGLKSVTTFNYDTIISYEGCVQMPVTLFISPYNDKNKGFPYTARVLFSPLRFPDQWDALRRRFKIKKLLDNFLLFFQ